MFLRIFPSDFRVVENVKTVNVEFLSAARRAGQRKLLPRKGAGGSQYNSTREAQRGKMSNTLVNIFFIINLFLLKYFPH